MVLLFLVRFAYYVTILVSSLRFRHLRLQGQSSILRLVPPWALMAALYLESMVKLCLQSRGSARWNYSAEDERRTLLCLSATQNLGSC